MKVFLTYSYRVQKEGKVDYKLLEERLQQIQDLTLVTTRSKSYFTQAEERRIKRGVNLLDIDNTSPYEPPEIGQIHDGAMRRTILGSDFFIVEATERSVRLGMEVEFAISHKIPTLVAIKNQKLCRVHQKSVFIWSTIYEVYFKRTFRYFLQKSKTGAFI